MTSDTGRQAASGVVAILFTDLVGSTDLLARLGDDAAEALRREHFDLLRSALTRHGGEEVKSTGDGLMMAFTSPVKALGCAVAIQRAVDERNRASPGPPLGVRMGLNVGESLRAEDDYYGLAVNVAARLCARAQGGQILAGEAVQALVGPRGPHLFRPAGRLHLKGLPDPVAAVVVEWGQGARPAAPAPARAGPSRPRGPRLVGRDSELAALEEELTRAGAGEFRSVAVVADPGVGKTRLAAELLARHPEAVALSARASPLGATASFGLWAEALDRHLRGVAPEELADLCGGYFDDLAGLLRTVAARRGSVPDRPPSRQGLLEALAVLVANLARRGPVVAVLDDVHWADASSWNALRYLAETLPDERVLVLVLARPAELAEQQVAAEVLLGLEQDDVLRRLPLGALDERGLASLATATLGRDPPSALVDWLSDRARGNPLFALGLLRALLAEGADLDAPRLRSLPEGLAERVQARMGALAEPATDTIETMAVLGSRVELGELSQMTGRSLEELGPVLATLVRSRLVVEDEHRVTTETPSGPVEIVYEIDHPLVTETIYQGLGAARRRLLHRRVGRALLAAGRLGEAAPHFARSGEAVDAEAVDALIGALRQAEERDAYREALTILGAIVDLLPGRSPRWLEVAGAMNWQAGWVIEHRADALAVVGARALSAVDAVLDADPGGADPALRAGVKLRLTTFLGWGLQDPAAAEPHAWQAVGLYRALGDERRALLALNEVAWMRGMQGDEDAMAARASEVVTSARAVGETAVAIQATVTRGWVRYWRGEFSAAVSDWSEVLDLAHQTGDAYRRAYALSMLAATAAFEGRLGEAGPKLEEAKSVGSVSRETLVIEMGSWVSWFAGDFRRAAQALAEVEAWNPDGLRGRRRYNLTAAALAAAECGRVPEARTFLGDTRIELAGRRWFKQAALADWLEGLLAWLEGHAGAAVPRLEQAIAGFGESTETALVLADLAEAAWAAGDVSAAAGAAGRAAEVAARLDRNLYWALSALCSAWAQLAAGHPGVAAEAASRAVSLLRPLGYRAFLARAIDVLGRAMSGADPAGAVAARTEAARLFDRCGSPWRRHRVLGLSESISEASP